MCLFAALPNTEDFWIIPMFKYFKEEYVVFDMEPSIVNGTSYNQIGFGRLNQSATFIESHVVVDYSVTMLKTVFPFEIILWLVSTLGAVLLLSILLCLQCWMKQKLKRKFEVVTKVLGQLNTKEIVDELLLEGKHQKF